ncbi:MULTISPECIES: anthranilate phosphoribosyltransferase [Prochlorococcus]|uniref:anthranilate phosphoribosyltransferase n=1 Tax=Prochlorococcus TaxID=1218 RepID=UPI0005339301|nr:MULTISPECIES: anthranilate phosphoribosyltransferase [Prochlorococcus]KGG12644.1 Anthranilate phosphoribosyltransferase [Prochlorococcus sp. MIT 0601]
MSNFSWPKVLDKLLEGNELQIVEASSLMKAWLNEDLTPAQTGAFLAALRSKGLTGLELATMAKVLREACSFPFAIPEMFLVDTCGTGGDGADTFNISTAVAFLASSLGVSVAKHGNRSASGKVGSADVLEKVGIKLDAPLLEVVNALEETNISFLFAPLWHSSLAGLAPFRKQLGVRTVFNLLGPLVNPFRPKAQVLGVAKPELLDPMAEALQELGLTRAVVVYGAGGLDEASLEGPSQVRFLKDDQITSAEIDITDLGLTPCSNSDLKGGDLNLNANILTSVLKGEGTRSQREVVALNTALVLWASSVEDDLNKGVKMALNALETSMGWKKLENLKQFLKSHSED